MVHRRSFIRYVSARDPGAIPKYQNPLLFARATTRAGKRQVRVDRGRDDEVRDTRDGRKAALPGPGPAHGDRPGTAYFELPIVIADRAADADGSRLAPDIDSWGVGEETDISARGSPELFGDTMLVNGGRWPFQVVQRRRYRLRVVNGCRSRFLFLDFAGIPGIRVWQIGNDAGFLVAPVDISGHHGNRVLLGPGERADCIVDFGEVAVGEYLLRNVGPDEPFSGGAPDVDFPAADPGSTGQVLQFRVVAAAAADRSTPPQFLRLPTLAAAPRATVRRRLALLEEMAMYAADSPGEPLPGVVDGGFAAWSAQP